MPVKLIRKKKSKAYFDKNSIEPMLIDNKEVCPWCGFAPTKILEHGANEGNIIFYKQCEVCKSVIKVVRETAEY